MFNKYLSTTGGATSPAFEDPTKGYGQIDNGEFVSAGTVDLWADYPKGTRAKLANPAYFNGAEITEFVKGIGNRWTERTKYHPGYSSLANLDANYPVAKVVGPPSPSIPEIEPAAAAPVAVVDTTVQPETTPNTITDAQAAKIESAGKAIGKGIKVAAIVTGTGAAATALYFIFRKKRK